MAEQEASASSPKAGHPAASGCKAIDDIVSGFEDRHDHPLDADHLGVLRARAGALKEIMRQLETNEAARADLEEQLLDADDARTLPATLPSHHLAVLQHARQRQRGGAR